jgi:hypothetical protein
MAVSGLAAPTVHTSLCIVLIHVSCTGYFLCCHLGVAEDSSFLGYYTVASGKYSRTLLRSLSRDLRIRDSLSRKTY